MTIKTLNDYMDLFDKLKKQAEISTALNVISSAIVNAKIQSDFVRGDINLDEKSALIATVNSIYTV